MADPFWPGDERAGEHFTALEFVRAMVEVESAWLGDVLEVPDDVEDIAFEAESGGGPVLPLVRRLRAQDHDVHRGLSSPDVVDSALMLMAEAASADLRRHLASVAARLAGLATEHRDTPMVARTLDQHALPTTFGFRVATWLTGILDADDDLARLEFPRRHATRSPVTRLGDALAGCTDACARIANDVLVMSRREIGELAEGAGGASSTMPHQANPVLAVLVRRAALTTPQLAATLHLAAAEQVDGLADGGWHAEWATLRDLVRRTLVAASQTDSLVEGLRVDTARMAATLEAAGDAVLAQQRSLTHDPAPTYLGDATAYVDEVVARAKETTG